MPLRRTLCPHPLSPFLRRRPQRGFFRIARGEDDSAFESMAVAADVVARLPRRRSAGKGARVREHTLLPDDVGQAGWPQGSQAAADAAVLRAHDKAASVAAVPPREAPLPSAHAAAEGGLSLWGGLRAALLGALRPKT